MTAGGDEQALEELLELLQAVNDQIDRAASEVGLTRSQAMLLRMIERPMRMGDLADLRVCDPSSLTTMALRLEASGLIVRRPDPSDRRARMITLTPAGRRVRRRFVTLLLDDDGIVAVTRQLRDDV